MSNVVIKVSSGTVKRVFTDDPDVKVIVLDADFPGGACVILVEETPYPIDAMAQGVPIVAPAEARKTVAEVVDALKSLKEDDPGALCLRRMLERSDSKQHVATQAAFMPFPFELTLGEDGETGSVRIGFVCDGMWIHDPFRSECGRFECNPEGYMLTAEQASYLKALNHVLETASLAALDAGCAGIQASMGECDGGFAGIFFSDHEHRQRIERTFAQYLLFQRSMMAS